MAPDDLIKAALAVRENAHAPYSSFRVGAALRDETGRVHVGCNVENAAYPSGLCAEAGAISQMIATAGKRCVEIVIVAGGPEAITPCGGCRQRLSEFANADCKVYCCDAAGQLQIETTLGALLPFGFSSDNLKR